VEWRVDKGNHDSERRQLNRILAEIAASVGASGSGGWNYITSEGDVYASADEADLYIGDSDA
jgi:hypothetical protein